MFLYQFFTSDDYYEVTHLMHERKFTKDEFMYQYNKALEFLKRGNLDLDYLGEYLVREYGYKFPQTVVTVNNPYLSDKPLTDSLCIEDLVGCMSFTVED